MLHLHNTASRLYVRYRRAVLHIDRPAAAVIEAPVSTVEGWFALAVQRADISLRIGGREARWSAMRREPVEALFGPNRSRGFRVILDLNQFQDLNGRVAIDLVVNGAVAATKQLMIAPAVSVNPERWLEIRRRKQDWLQANAACPNCASYELAFVDDQIRCARCGATFSNRGLVLDFLPPNVKDKFRIEDCEDISANEYDTTAQRLIEEVRRAGGKVLDCGSGFKTAVDETVIGLDVAPFPAVDVLAVNQRLPFRDAVFDAVFSLNVLEHVTDPFASAGELVRVLKPGGRLYCCIPFLQPEHGYPDHYFNATRSGLRQLFRDRLELLSHEVPRSGEPVWTLHWFLSRYAEHLTDEERREFLALRVRDILNEPVEALIDKPWVTKLADGGKWKLASTTSAIFRKP